MVETRKNLKRGEIIATEVNGEGHEQSGYRPWVIVSPDSSNRHMNIVNVVPLTTANRPFVSSVNIHSKPGVNSVALCNHIRSIDVTARKYKSVGSLKEEDLKKVLHKLQEMFSE